MNIAEIVIVAILVWFFVYVAVYYYYFSSKSGDHVPFAYGYLSSPSNHADSLSSSVELDHFTDPFLSSQCDAIVSSSPDASATVVVVARDPNPVHLYRTVKSVIQNSGDEMKQVVIVDDRSEIPVDSLSQWNEFFGRLTFLRNDVSVGTASSRNLAVEHIRKESQSQILIFLEVGVVVSRNWIAPLFATLSRHKLSIAYPALDVIDSDGSLIQSDNVIGAFDWSLSFVWEPVGAPRKNDRSLNRVPLASRTVDADSTVVSPAAPSIFAVSLEHFMDLGRFDTELSLDSRSPESDQYATNEFSLRVWMCGGSVIRQPCSRVAQLARNMHKSVEYGREVTQAAVDRVVMRIGELWMRDASMNELVFQSRFLGRIPNFVEISFDSRLPKQLHYVPKIASESCKNFKWFLENIFPGLLDDVESVQQAFQEHITSPYLINRLKPLIEAYGRESDVQFSSDEILRLKQELEISLRKSSSEVVAEADKQKREQDAHEEHMSLVRDSLVCKDQPALSDDMNCQLRAKKGDCEHNMVYMMFSCPRACKLCTHDNLVCTDLYLKKCPTWKAEGQCESNREQMEVKCRFSCGICTRASDTIRALSDSNILKPAASTSVGADPFVSQHLFASGQLPDPTNNNLPCELKGKPNGQLLAKMTLMPVPSNAPRLFCGIYTMESKHETNVKATRDTWAKRCTGFLAFSTATDPTIPGTLNFLSSCFFYHYA